MGKIIEIPFSKDLVAFIAERLLEKEGYDFSSVAIVFPHQRPGIYLRQIMAKELEHPFFPPQIFSMDEFMSFLAQKTLSSNPTLLSNLDSTYLLFKIVEKIPHNPWQKVDSSFNQFLFWGLKLQRIIEELDIEMVEDKKLKSIEMGDLWEPNVAKHAAILMNHLAHIRQEYHALLKKYNLISRGRNYAIAAANIEKLNLDQFKEIYFAGLFAMTKAEKIITRYLLRQPEVNLIRQSDGGNWTPFEEMNTWGEAVEVRRQKVEDGGQRTEDREQKSEVRSQKTEDRGQKIENGQEESSRIFLHSAFNTHCEVVGLKDILVSKEANHEKTAIVLPEPELLIPLLSEVMTTLAVDYNITMGYPLVRTPVYALLDLFIKLQETKREHTYYLEDYLSLLMHPYIKNISHIIESTPTRILIHSIEETLLEKNKAFIELYEIEQNMEIFERVAQMTEKKISIQDIRNALVNIHNIFIRKIEGINTLAQIGSSFEEILIFILKHSPAAHYPFSGEFFNSFFTLLNKLTKSLLKDEIFSNSKDLFDLFRHIAKEEHIPFKGIPLKGLQILGILETRCLNFNKVFLLRANEGILPSVKPYDSLLPLPLRNALGIPSHYQNEEIYRYHFNHLISCAQEVHIFYQENEKESRSRFIESLVWEEEKKKGHIGSLKARAVELNISLGSSSCFEVAKNQEILDILHKINFSATALNSYLACPIQFYFTNVLEIKEKEKFLGDVDTARIGVILHKVMEKLYQPFIGKGILGKNEYAYLEKELNKILEAVFLENFAELRGEPYLLKEMAFRHLKKYILSEKEKFMDNISIISTEETLSFFLEINEYPICLRGRADRIDRLGEEYIIIDYKAGNISRHSSKIFSKILPSRKEMKEEIISLQLPLYALLYQQAHSISPNKINSKLISLQTAKDKILFKEEDRQEFLENIFLPTIKNLIKEILNPKIPFVSDYKSKECQYCPYPTFCRKRW